MLGPSTLVTTRSLAPSAVGVGGVTYMSVLLATLMSVGSTTTSPTSTCSWASKPCPYSDSSGGWNTDTDGAELPNSTGGDVGGGWSMQNELVFLLLM